MHAVSQNANFSAYYRIMFWLQSKQLDLVKEVGLRAAGFQQPGAAAAAAANLYAFAFGVE